MNLKRMIVGLSAALYSCRSSDFDACIDRAESLWEALTLRGHGDKDKAEANPRDARDWYAALSDAQKPQFDAFWTAYGLKKGKNRAAMRWFQMGEFTPEEMAHILHAAKREREEWGGSCQRDNGQTRKFAEGWLSERRWEDHPKPEVGRNSGSSRIAPHGEPSGGLREDANPPYKPVRTKEAREAFHQQAQAALGRGPFTATTTKGVNS